MSSLLQKNGMFSARSNHINRTKYDLVIMLFILSVLLIPIEVFSGTATVLSSESGGRGGAPFADMAAPGGAISKITIRSGKFIDSIQLTYRYKTNTLSRAYGGTGGRSKSFSLRKGEYITEFGGRSGKYVDSIYVKTNIGRIERWGGNGGGRSFKFTGTKYSPIQGVWGRSGALIDAIGVIKPSSNSSQGCSAQSDLKSYIPDPNRTAAPKETNSSGSSDGFYNEDAADSFTSPIFPTIKDFSFWENQNIRLKGIVNHLSKSPREFNTYINRTESEHCKGHLYCEIDTRTDLIFKVLGAK